MTVQEKGMVNHYTDSPFKDTVRAERGLRSVSRKQCPEHFSEIV
jgi:hypothetical protein